MQIISNRKKAILFLKVLLKYNGNIQLRDLTKNWGYKRQSIYLVIKITL